MSLKICTNTKTENETTKQTVSADVNHDLPIDRV